MGVLKLMLVDDHKMIRDSLKTYLISDARFEIVAEAENGKGCLDILKTVEVDIVLTDIIMPEMDGLELAKEIKEKFNNIKVIALTMLGESQHIKQMLANGAEGYLLKNCGEQEIKMAIEKVSLGGTYYAPEVTTVIMNNIRKVKPQGAPLVIVKMPLSDREKEVLRLILKEYTNQEIADELFISIRTVDAHKRNLLDKTGCKSVTGLVFYALDQELFDDL